MTEHQARYSARAVERIFKILKAFDVQRTQRGYLEIAQETQIPASTTFKLMQILTELGVLDQNGEAGRYRIGLEAFRLGSLYLTDRPLVETAAPILEGLAGRLGMLASLGIRNQETLTVLLGKQGFQGVGLTMHLGERGPLHLPALGKALLFDCQEPDLRKILSDPLAPTPTPKSIRTIAQLAATLRQARLDGHTVDDEEAGIGIFCIGCPVRDHLGQIVAAISVTGVKAAVIDKVSEMAAETQAAAKKISALMGYRPGEREER